MIEITPRIEENQRIHAGQIYYEAFRRKLQPLVGSPDETREVLTDGLNLGMALGAMNSGELVGLAGLHTSRGVFSQVRLRTCITWHGTVRGMYAWGVLNMFGVGTKCAPGQVRIAALAVAPAYQGRGIGRQLLEAVINQAKSQGAGAVRLEVVDTNLGARRLYERCGFNIIETHSYPIREGWLGFSRDHVMIRKI